VGYLHTGMDKQAESKIWQHFIPMTDRMDYLSPWTNNIAFCLSVERLLGCEVPERGVYLRVILCELSRIASHLVWLGTHAMDIGAVGMSLYTFREREQILQLFEAQTGTRMTVNGMRIGGLPQDVPEGWTDRTLKFVDEFEARWVPDYDKLLRKNPMWLMRTQGIGIMTREELIAWGVTGPCLRASGIDYDLRKHMPYGGYENFEFDVPTGEISDVWNRYLCRMEEMHQSCRIIRQALKNLPGGRVITDDPHVALPDRDKLHESMESLIHHFKLVCHGIQVPEGEAYVPTEGSKGEIGYYIVSDGGGKPVRIKTRSPSFCNLQAIEEMVRGRLVADVVAVIGSLDIVLGEIDR